MFIELTEILCCPACDAGAGMVAFVDRLDGRRVVEGYLGCPFCEARRPVHDGIIYMGGIGEPVTEGSIDAASDAPDSTVSESPAGESLDRELAIQAAALLGLHERPGGYALLDEGLSGVAAEVAALATGTEIVALVGLPMNDSVGSALETSGDAEPPAAAAVNYIAVAPADALPILPGKLRGIVLRHATADRVESAVRALGFEGRLVVLAPNPAVTTALEAGRLRLLAADERALVAVRE